MKLVLTLPLLFFSLFEANAQKSDSLKLSSDPAYLQPLVRTTRFPMEAQRNGIYAKIYAGFHINTQGHVEDVVILNPEKVGYGLEDEVKRTLNRLPPLHPRYVGEYVVPFLFGYGAPGDPNPILPKGTLPAELMENRRLLDTIVIMGYSTSSFRRF